MGMLELRLFDFPPVLRYTIPDICLRRITKDKML